MEVPSEADDERRVFFFLTLDSRLLTFSQP